MTRWDSALDSLPSPKQTIADRSNAAWYPYYAGFNGTFARSALRQLVEFCPSATVMDPWNGAGTTTYASARAGMPSIGFDLNPVMGIVALSRMCTREDKRAVDDLREGVANRLTAQLTIHRPQHALDRWFGRKTADRLYSLQQAIRDDLPSSTPERVRAMLWVAAFRTIRSAFRPFETSNPTWYRIRPPRRRVGVPAPELATQFDLQLDHMLMNTEPRSTLDPPSTLLVQANSLALPLASNTIDIAITSPPYCTRIDYVIATLPELTLLGFDFERVSRLRPNMTGTPLTSNAKNHAPTSSRRLDGFLTSVRQHGSKAAGTYYLTYFKKYYSDLSVSLMELSRCLRVGGIALLVVQDSYFREIRNPVDSIIIDLARPVGLRLVAQRHFDVPHNMAHLNPRARQYRTTIEATESCLLFRRQ